MWLLVQIRKDLFKYFQRYCNPKFEKWKNTKKWSRSHVEAGRTCGFIPGTSWQTKTWSKTFHSNSIIKLSRNEAFRHFLVNFIKRLAWKRWPLQKCWLQFLLYISQSYDCTKFHYHQVTGKKLSIKIFKFFISDHLTYGQETLIPNNTKQIIHTKQHLRIVIAMFTNKLIKEN